MPTGPTSVDDAEDDLDEKSSSSRADAKYAGASFAKRKYRRHPKVGAKWLIEYCFPWCSR